MTIRWLALVVLLFVLVPARARAQSTPAELDRNFQAVARGELGLDAFRRGDWGPAYRHFREAETLVHSPVFLLYMARARANQSALEEALDLYARVSAENLTDASPEAFRHAVSQATLEGQALRAHAEAEASAKRRLPPAADEAPRPVGVSSRRPHGDARPPGRSPTRTGAAIAAGSIGATGVVLGAAAGLVALVKLNELKARCRGRHCDPGEQGNLDEVNLWGRLSELGFLVGGAGLATSAVFLWVAPGSVGKSPSSEHAGLGISGRMDF